MIEPIGDRFLIYYFNFYTWFQFINWYKKQEHRHRRTAGTETYKKLSEFYSTRSSPTWYSTAVLPKY